MKVLIFGSSGQIGAYLTNYLSFAGHEVITFDKVNSSFEDMAKIPNAYLDKVVSECDFCFFLGF